MYVVASVSRAEQLALTRGGLEQAVGTQLVVARVRWSIAWRWPVTNHTRPHREPLSSATHLIYIFLHMNGVLSHSVAALSRL